LGLEANVKTEGAGRSQAGGSKTEVRSSNDKS